MSSTLQRLLHRTLPDDKQINKDRKSKKSRSTRKSKAQKAALKQHLQTITDADYSKNKKIQTTQKNLKALKSWTHEDNSETEDQLKELREKIILSRNLSTGPKRRKQQKVNKRSWPGLTPGLAPVGYESSDEEDS